MKKKIIIISLIVVLAIGLGIGGFFLVKHFTDKGDDTPSESPKVATTIILDINPSIKVLLDKDNKVIKMEALNDDAKDILYSDCKGKELDYVIYKLVNNLVDKGYAEEKITILVSSEGEVKTEEVQKLIKNELTSKSIENEVISVIEKINDEVKEKAKEYGISDGKASFIEEIIEGNSELTFEDLKDKTIAELNELKNKKEETKKEEPKQEEKKEEPKQNTNSGSSNSGSSSGNKGTVSYTCTPPSDIKSSEWCQWNVRRPQNCEYNYPGQMELSGNDSKIFSALGLSSGEMTQGYTVPKERAGASYCQSYVKRIMTRDAFYTVEFDSVTGEIYSSNKQAVNTTYSEEQIKQMGREYWKVAEEDIDMIWAVLGFNANPDNIFITYQVNFRTKDGKNYSVDYNANTGAVLSSRSW